MLKLYLVITHFSLVSAVLPMKDDMFACRQRASELSTNWKAKNMADQDSTKFLCRRLPARPDVGRPWPGTMDVDAPL